MNQERTEEPFGGGIEAWIRERESLHPEAGSRPGDPRDQELLALLVEASQVRPREVSEQEAAELLERIRSRAGGKSTRPTTRRDSLLAAAAVLSGLAVGLAMLPRSNGLATAASTGTPAQPRIETVKRMSFESIHQGKVVRFQLELTRVR